jgi:hypothetical protein
MDIPGAEARDEQLFGASLEEGGPGRTRSASTGTPLRVGSADTSALDLRDEARRDGGAMRRVESLEKLAPELGQHSSSFESKGGETPVSADTIMPFGLEDDDGTSLSPARGGASGTVSHRTVGTTSGQPVFQNGLVFDEASEGYEIHEGSAGPDDVQTVRASPAHVSAAAGPPLPCNSNSNFPRSLSWLHCGATSDERSLVRLSVHSPAHLPVVAWTLRAADVVVVVVVPDSDSWPQSRAQRIAQPSTVCPLMKPCLLSRRVQLPACTWI